MSISSIRSRTDEIAAPDLQQTGAAHDKLKLLLELFSEAEQALASVGAACAEPAGAFRQRDEIIDAQAQILRKAASLKAPLIRDVLYKLALWRCWSASEIDPRLNDMFPADAVVYSAFVDLVEILGERDLLTAADLANPRG